ncbi:MAG: hypothetical protein GWP75_06650 [Planctomycetia bacterium]|nr:hypothetical protein [Planctomycetia bacterium]
MSRRTPLVLFLAGLAVCGAVLAPPVFADDAVGVFEAVDGDGTGVWRIDGDAYIVDPDVATLGSVVVPAAGELVWVKFEARDGARHVTTLSPLGFGPEAVQDGPYLLWSDADSAVMITVVDGEVVRTEHDGIAAGDAIPTPSGLIPKVIVGAFSEAPAADWPDATRILAVSDLEGNRETFMTFLRGNGVIDDRGRWTWGDGHLVLDGDIVDRGAEVTELLWTIRRLEREAEQAGGRVHYVLGNHESMVMAGDLRYIHPKYRFTTDRIGETYDALHGPSSELGRWLRSRNSVIRVGPFLFVHAGYSPELDRLQLGMEAINETIRSGLGPPAWPAAAREDLRTGLIWHQQGPHWYRGYFPRHAAQWGGRPSDEAIAAILERHGAEHVVVGHTVVEDIGWIDGRPTLIGIDVAWRDPSEAAGLLFDGDGLHRVDSAGRRTPLRRPVTFDGGE